MDSEIEWNQDKVESDDKDYYFRSSWISYLLQGICFGDGKAPPSLKRPPDHGRAGGGSGRGEAEWVLKPESNNLNAQVHKVHSGVEVRKVWLRQLRRDIEADAMEGLCMCV